MKTFFFFDFDEDNIISNLADAAPGDNIFTLSSGEEAKFTRSGNDQCGNRTCFAVEFQINRAAETAAGTGVDDFFLSKLT